MLQRRLDTEEGAERGHRGGIAAAPCGGAGNVRRARTQEVGILERQPDILAGIVLAVEGSQHLGIGLQHGRRLFCLRIRLDDGLAAAERHAGDGRLEGHAARKPQRIGKGGLEGRMRPNPRAAECGAQRRVVDRDDGREAAFIVLAEPDLFVIIEGGKPRGLRGYVGQFQRRRGVDRAQGARLACLQHTFLPDVAFPVRF